MAVIKVSMAVRKNVNVFVLHLTTDVKCSIITIEREVKNMRALKYRLENGTVVNSMSQANASGQKYEVLLEEIRETNRENISPIRKAMLEQFGYVHSSLKDKVVLD